MNEKRNWAAPLSAVALAVVLSACGGGGDGSNSNSSSASGGGGSGSTASSFPYTRYDVYGPYGTATVSGSGPVTAASASKAAIAAGGSFAFRGALAGGETDITLGTGSVTLFTTIVSANDLSWLAPGADGQLLQQCSVVRLDVNGATATAYPKSLLVMVANTATALAKLSSIPTGTQLYSAEDCKFTGATPSADIATVTTQANDYVTVNADGSLTAAQNGSASFTVSAANISAALASGGTGVDTTSTGIALPSMAGIAAGSYALHAYSLPRSGLTPRYVLVIQATPAGGNVGSRGVVAMLVSK